MMTLRNKDVMNEDSADAGADLEAVIAVREWGS